MTWAHSRPTDTVFPICYIPLFLLIHATYIQVYFHMFHYLSIHHSDYILRRTQSTIDFHAPHFHTIHCAHLDSFIFHSSRFTTYTPHFTLPHKGRSTYRALVHDQTDALVYSMQSGMTCVPRSVSAHNRAFSPVQFSLLPSVSSIPVSVIARCVCVASPTFSIFHLLSVSAF